MLGWLRLAVIAITFAVAMYAFGSSTLAGWLVIAAGIALFLLAVAIDAKNNEKIAHNERMLTINEEELKILEHNFDHRDDGKQYEPHDHAYAADIDLFGAFSLYQFTDRCTSEQGKALLANRLLAPLDKEMILYVQQAVKELAPQVQWRQEFQAAGIANPLSLHAEGSIHNWLQSKMPYSKPIWKFIVWIYAFITLATVAAYSFEFINSSLFTLLVFVYFFTGLSISKNINETYSKLSKIVDEVVTLNQQLRHFENLQVQSPLLVRFQQQLSATGKASASIHQLRNILNRFDYRLNILVFFLLNTFLLWDLKQLLALRKWRKQHKQDVAHWFETVAQLEVVSTLATLHFNYPQWVFPEVVDQHFTLHATDVGHPLIKEKVRVNNSFSTTGTGRVAIITGSNMAGKSTFLRSIGVNIVLAQMGAPVCATSFTLSPVNLYTSMRIADNLAENTSTFYAELKKLKRIIEQVNTQEKMFILLDEILRGTNSLDRHTGSKALIKQLLNKRAVAVIATHDVELAALERSYITSIKNYHFDVQVEGEELYFDYKLKTGICQSLNASILMKKIGIQMEP